MPSWSRHRRAVACRSCNHSRSAPPASATATCSPPRSSARCWRPSVARRPRRAVAVKKSAALLAVIAALVGALPAVASAGTLRLFSKPIDQAGGVFDPNGNPVAPNQEPPIGSVFVGADRDYKGTRKHHAKGVFGYDHVVCTVVASAQGRCNANIVLRNGAIYASNFMLDLQAPTQIVTTGLFGTGVYGHVSSVTNRNFPDGTAELVIRY